MRMDLQGVIGQRVSANIENWLLQVPESNPAILQMFRDRDRKPHRKACPWAGEFAGKFLTSAVLATRMTGDERLKEMTDSFARDLIESQGDDGYMGPHPRDQRFFGVAQDGIHDGGPLWDVWGHYHCMLGLLLWHQESGYRPALDACTRAADLICRTFLDAGVQLIATKAQENQGVLHVFTLLYQEAGEPRYLRMARKIIDDWEKPGGIDYMQSMLGGKDYYQTNYPRWEGLHAVQGLAEMYLITGEEKYRQVVQRVWTSIAKLDRHNTGAFSSGEGAVGNPYDPGAIETCCTVAWIALSIDMLKLTGDSLIADEIELATFNAMLGAQSPTGRWWTYNTPMDGQREASFHTIRFQAQPGGAELNCCSVNGPRSIGMISDWAIINSPDGFVVSYYGPGRTTITDASGGEIEFVQETDYPLDGRIMLTINPGDELRFKIRLRIPAWSRSTSVSVNGESVGEVNPGTYLLLDQVWKDGDTVEILLDMSLRFWVGERECEGKTSIYRGPILLAYDQRFNAMDPDDVPSLDAGALSYEWSPWDGDLKPWMLLRFKARDGRDLYLCDFAGAGAGGTHYRTWLPVDGLSQAINKNNQIWRA
ncbi:MAG: beta-L-arabinofuranosidase domain-containing protein [Armatimonadota bacterium]